MSHVLRKGAERLVLDEPDARTLSDLLLPDEVAQIQAGALVADLNGAVLALDSPLPPSAEIHLRSPQPSRDQAAFLYRINTHGDRVRIGELLTIRAFEEATGQQVWGMELEALRDDVADWETSRPLAVGFFDSVAARAAAHTALVVPPGHSARRSLRGLGRVA